MGRIKRLFIILAFYKHELIKKLKNNKEVANNG